MKKEKKFLNLINKDIPENKWEADYLIEKSKDLTTYLISIGGLGVVFIVLLALLIILTGTIQCSVNIEFEGKGNIVLVQEELPSTIEKFEFEEGKIKIGGTVPCSFLTIFGKYGGGY